MGKPSTFKAWIEAMRLRTLPVSIAGVILATGYAMAYSTFHCVPAVLCLIFAVLAQIASNFANEYFDYKAGIDKPGRVGPRRSVTEGDITPAAMRNATFLTLGIACMIGCTLMLFAGWWLLIVGIFIALGVVAYSAGPFPLSRIGLGEVAVMLFFGVIPVNLTYYLQSLEWNVWVGLASIALGLMGANVIIVNNYRDRDEDAAVGKRTLAVRLGRKAMSSFYLTNGYIAVALMMPTWVFMNPWSWLIPGLYVVGHTAIWWQLITRPLDRLTPVLGMTAVLMLAYSLGFAAAAAAM